MADNDDDHDWSEPSGASGAPDDEDDLDGYFSDGGEEQDPDDDPWANVKSEDELKQTSPDDEGGGGDGSGDDGSGGGGRTGGGDPPTHSTPFGERLEETLKQNDWMLNDFAEEAGYEVAEMADILNDDTDSPLSQHDRQWLLDLAARGGTVEDSVDSTGTTDEAPAQNHQTEAHTPVPDKPDADDISWADMDAIEGEFIPEDVTCEGCTHRDVCVILNSFVPMLRDENWDAGTPEDGSPIDPMDMAKICDSYHPDEDAPQKEAPDAR
jgi:hypothetical protein